MSQSSPSRVLDLRGEVCPFTSVRARLAVEELPAGAILRIIVDHEPASRNVPRSIVEWGQQVSGVSEIEPAVWEITVAKTTGDAVATGETLSIYLDHNATTPVDARVRSAMVDALTRLHGNPSSIHAAGRAARAAIEQARRHVATMIGGESHELVFTSGGTEAAALGILGLARIARHKRRPAVAIVPAIDHPASHGAVAALAEFGFTVVTAPVDSGGLIDSEALAGLCAHGASLLALSLANHELGTVQPVAELTEIAHQHGALVYCDAVQGAGKLAISCADLGVDALAISAHKFYGPKGVGGLWARADLGLSALISAGHQERERRPGTENSAGIVGMAAAAGLASSDWLPAQQAIAKLRDRLEGELVAACDARVHGGEHPRVANTTNIGFPGARGDVVAGALDLHGIAVSTGSACTSGVGKPSPVLLALGLAPERAEEAVRFSLGVATSTADIDATVAALPAIVARARRYR